MKRGIEGSLNIWNPAIMNNTFLENQIGGKKCVAIAHIYSFSNQLMDTQTLRKTSRCNRVCSKNTFVLHLFITH